MWRQWQKLYKIQQQIIQNRSTNKSSANSWSYGHLLIDQSKAEHNRLNFIPTETYLSEETPTFIGIWKWCPYLECWHISVRVTQRKLCALRTSEVTTSFTSEILVYLWKVISTDVGITSRVSPGQLRTGWSSYCNRLEEIYSSWFSRDYDFLQIRNFSEFMRDFREMTFLDWRFLRFFLLGSL